MASPTTTSACSINEESLAIIPLLESCRNIPLLMNEGWAASQLLKYQTVWIMKLRIGRTSNGLLDEETLRQETEIRETLPANVSHLKMAVETCIDMASSRPPSPTEFGTLDRYEIEGAYDADDDSVYETESFPQTMPTYTVGPQPYTPTSPTSIHFQTWKGNIQRAKKTVESRLASLQFFADQVKRIHYRKLRKVPDSRFRRREYAHLGNIRYQFHPDVDVEDLIALRKKVLGVLFGYMPRAGGVVGRTGAGTSRLSDLSDDRLQSLLQIVFGVLRRRNRFNFWGGRNGAAPAGVTQSQRRGRPVLGSLIHARWPAPPRLRDGDATFICPICGDTLLRAESEHGNWEIHVSADLSPYTCFIPTCKTSTTFRHREDLHSHLETTHGQTKYYKCYPCSTHGIYREFHSKADIHEHLDLDHPTFDRSRERGRPPVKLTRPAGVRECPVCFLQAGEAWDPEQFLDHVGVHLRDLALLAVPGVVCAAVEEGEGEEGVAVDGEVLW
ncbi:uncharacterized protein BO80DRAFT_445805 [Aspergillus ibericus CBS 121593]|uniref:C2H2-type domain-containing protein n=1 Tax=Aspergillus ibericus CBS 121593 TaxID=1448316 RepID=A0A395GWZ8_9EURO|nr:hypothetical protein BO80DRAFT_445805 [Aspergillus ibericus CBS 121593]RAL00101.1 hypothetical protein BO80DRAFT_445805 [Aspergillus ibericus CBS 121593]